MTSGPQCVKVSVMSLQAKRATPGDWLDIERLIQRAYRRLPRLWWWEEHLSDDLFVVLERRGEIVGALLAWPDESPVAWVRLAGLDDSLEIGQWLDLTLPLIIEELRRRGTRSLAWMDYGDWAGPHLERRGFARLVEVTTLAKFDRALPALRDLSTHYLRPAADGDIPATVAVDRIAFTPHWWHSEESMRRRAATAFHFMVAEVAGTVVGYAEGELHPPDAHLNRIALHPDYQGRGIGAALLHDALHAFWRGGAEQVTLNTQVNNHPARRLYRRFGFEEMGSTVTAWELQL